MADLRIFTAGINCRTGISAVFIFGSLFIPGSFSFGKRNFFYASSSDNTRHAFILRIRNHIRASFNKIYAVYPATDERSV